MGWGEDNKLIQKWILQVLISFAPVTSFLGVLRIMRCEQFYKQTFTAILIISNSGFVNSTFYTIELYIAMKHLWSFMIWSLHIECKWYKTSKGSVLPKVIIYIKQQKRRWKWLLICWFFWMEEFGRPSCKYTFLFLFSTNDT